MTSYPPGPEIGTPENEAAVARLRAEFARPRYWYLINDANHVGTDDRVEACGWARSEAAEILATSCAEATVAEAETYVREQAWYSDDLLELVVREIHRHR